MAMAMAQSARATAARPDLLEIRFYIDHDDPERFAYRARFAAVVGGATLHQGRCVGVSKAWNELAGATEAELLFLANDDVVFVSPGWDDAFREEFSRWPDGIAMAWCDDGINGEAHAAFPCVPRRWVETLGYFAPDAGFAFFRNDTWIHDLALRVGRARYIPKVKIEHRHHTVTGDADETTLRNRRDGQSEKDRARWLETESQRKADAEKLRAGIESFRCAGTRTP